MNAVPALARFSLRAAIFTLKVIVAFGLGISLALIGMIAGHYIPHYYH